MRRLSNCKPDAYPSSLPLSTGDWRAAPSALRRSGRFGANGEAALRAAARRNLQSRRAVARTRVVRHSGIYGRCRWAGRAAHPRGDPRGGSREKMPLLPGILLRNVRQGAGSAADGKNAVLAALALWVRQSLRLLAYG